MENLKWHNEKRIVKDLIPFEKNPRKITDKQKDDLKRSLEKFDLVEIPAIDTDNKIIAGHQRIKILQLLGRNEEEIDVRVPNRKLTEEEFKEYNLRSNRNTAEWDYDLLSEFDYELLKDVGFDEEELDKMFEIEPDEKDDVVPETPKEPKSKLGDIYELPAKCGGMHRVLCGDSTKQEDVEKLMNGEKADMVYNDPPYGMFLDADFSDMEGIGKGNRYKNVIGDHNDFTNDFILKPLDFFDYCKEIFLWGADYYAEVLPKRNDGSWIVWDKMQGGEGVNDKYDKMFGSNFELCWSKKKHKRALARVLWKGIFGLSKEPERKRLHPTQKPIELSNWFIEKYSKKENIIVDLFLGSGSTLIACEKTNRILYGCEISPHYIDVIIQRYCDYTGNKEIIKNGEKIIWE